MDMSIELTLPLSVEHVIPKCRYLSNGHVVVGGPGRCWTYLDTGMGVEPVSPYPPEFREKIPKVLIELEMVALSFFNRLRELDQ